MVFFVFVLKQFNKALKISGILFCEIVWWSLKDHWCFLNVEESLRFLVFWFWNNWKMILGTSGTLFMKEFERILEPFFWNVKESCWLVMFSFWNNLKKSWKSLVFWTLEFKIRNNRFKVCGKVLECLWGPVF